MITRASAFMHCAGGLEKERVQGDVMPFGRISVPPKNAKDPPTCIRLFSEKTSTRFDLYAAVFNIWMFFPRSRARLQYNRHTSRRSVRLTIPFSFVDWVLLF